jgi:hypothetical protein
MKSLIPGQDKPPELPPMAATPAYLMMFGGICLWAPAAMLWAHPVGVDLVLLKVATWMFFLYSVAGMAWLLLATWLHERQIRYWRFTGWAFLAAYSAAIWIILLSPGLDLPADHRLLSIKNRGQATRLSAVARGQ